MARRRAAALTVLLCLLATVTGCGGTAGAGRDTVVVYSADGLDDWYTTQFEKFRAETGITVAVTTAGSSEVVARAENERYNPVADLLVTLPPFIQRADDRGLLQQSLPANSITVPETMKASDRTYYAFMSNYANMVYSPKTPRVPQRWQDLLAPEFAGKIQYSTPGQAGDGTAMLVLLSEVFGREQALRYFGELERNTVGPSSSTGALQPKVSKGELFVANGDLQMNLSLLREDPNSLRIFFPTDEHGEKHTVALPYYAGMLVHAPHQRNALRLLDFLFTEQTQQSTVDAFGTPTRTDVTPKGTVAAQVRSLLRGVRVHEPDWNQVLRAMPTDLADYTKAVRR